MRAAAAALPGSAAAIEAGCWSSAVGATGPKTGLAAIAAGGFAASAGTAAGSLVGSLLTIAGAGGGGTAARNSYLLAGIGDIGAGSGSSPNSTLPAAIRTTKK